MPREVGHHEQKVAELLRHLRRSQRVPRLDQLARLLDQLGEHLIRGRPVEPHPRRPLLQLHRPGQRRQPQSHAVQHARLATLSRLHPFPVRRLLLGRLIPAFVTEDMRMPRHHLVSDCAHHVVKVEHPLVRRDLRLKHRLKQQIAQLGRQFLPRPARDHILDLMRLFDRIGRDRREILRQIPWAARNRIAQPPHDFQQSRHAPRRIVDQIITRHCSPRRFQI